MLDDDGSRPYVALVGSPKLRRRSLAALLNEHGFEVTAVETVDDCLDLLSDGAVDGVVSCHDLPNSTGIDLVQSLQESYPSISTVLVVEDGSERLASRAIAEGADGYVPRETPPQTAVDRLRTHLGDESTESERRYRNLIETSPAPINLFDEDGRTVWGNDAVLGLLGLSDRDELVGRSIFEFIHPDDREIAEAELAEIIERGDGIGPTYMRLVRSDGDVRHVRVATAAGRYRGERIGQAVVVDVTPIRNHESRLARLNELLTACLLEDDGRGVCRQVVRAADSGLNLPVTMVALLDDESGELCTVAETDDAREFLDESRLVKPDDGPAWEVFATGEDATLTPGADGVDDAAPIDDLYVHPLGRHGVLLVGTADDGCDFVELIASNVHTTLDRVERESLLRKREERLEEQNDLLERLNRTNDVIRSIDRTLIGASTRSEIERAVCRKLTETDLFTFAWIGEYEPSTKRVVPRESDGYERGYLEEVAFTGDERPTGQGPTGRAVRTREPQVTNDVLSDPPFEPWREAALRRGYRSSIALPLVFRDSLYGVLNVYADEPDVFDELERQVLDELSDAIAHALNAIESKRALVSDTVVELELHVAAPDYPLIEFVQRAEGREFELEGVIPSDDGGYRVVATVRNATPADLETLAKRSVTVEECRVITERGGTCLFEATVSEESLVFWLVDHGARPRSLSVGHEGGRLCVELPGDADVRDFVERFQSKFPGSRLVARRERERPVRTRQEFLASFEEQLTSRQQEILETAYFSGYFETPRDRTGSDIAESLGISQPTFSDHLRASLRNLLGLVYERESQ